MSESAILRSELGVVTAPNEDPRIVLAVKSNDTESVVELVLATGTESFRTARIEQSQNSGRLVFTSNKVKYSWRPVREADGIWLSQYKIPLPIEAIPGVITIGDTATVKELLTAFSSGDSPYVLGVVYENSEGRFVRSGGTWLPIVEDDNTYADMDRIEIDPSRSEAFLELYDKNYVTVSDASSYESSSE